jgi:small subunit ribosomal protein S13
MTRISGINIPDNKQVEYSLPYIFGIGHTLSKKILTDAKIDPTKRTKELTSDEVKRIQEYIEKNYKIEGELRREIKKNITRLVNVASYRGSRHTRHLPAHGQRTKTNARTVRGRKKITVGSGRKKAASPK